MDVQGGSGSPPPEQPTHVHGATGGDVPTIGQPAPSPSGSAPSPLAPSPFDLPPNGPPFSQIPPPVGPPAGPTAPTPGSTTSRTGAVVLAIAGVLAVAVAVAALFVALSGGDRSDDAALATTTVAPPPPPTDPAPTTVPTSTPPASTEPPTTTVGSGSTAAAYGSYVAMLWSDVLANVDAAEIQRMADAKESQYGVPTTIVYGDDFLSLRDGTVGVVFAGGFTSPRDAASWCRDRGERSTGCFGVGLNDTYTENDRDGTGRMYVNEL